GRESSPSYGSPVRSGTNLLEVRFGEQEGKRLVLPQAGFQAVERVLPAERGTDLLRRLLQLGGHLVEVAGQVLLRCLDLLFLGDRLEQQITFHLQERTLPELVAHPVEVEAELAGIDAAPHEPFQHPLEHGIDVALDQRRRRLERVLLDQGGEHGLALIALRALLLALLHVAADLRTKLGHRLLFASQVLDEGVVERRHLAPLQALHHHLEPSFLAPQVLHGVVARERRRQLARLADAGPEQTLRLVLEERAFRHFEQDPLALCPPQRRAVDEALIVRG